MISLLDVYESVKDSIRPLREGEEYFRSGLLMCVGVKEKKGNIVKCVGLAAQTSGVFSYPHEIEAEIDTSKAEGQRILSLKCKCPAGNSGRCKHCISLLLYLNRIDEVDLDDLTCTDLEQQWGVLKKSHCKSYEAKCLDELCHVKTTTPKRSVPEITNDMKTKWREILLKSALSSEYSLFFSGLRMPNSTLSMNKDASSRIAEALLTISKLLSFRSWSLLGYLITLTSHLLEKCDETYQLFYQKNVQVSPDQCVKIGAALHQGSNQWMTERLVRITGSTCYNLFTYSSNKEPDWDKKFISVYKSTFSGNSDTFHGLRCEPLARNKYIENTNAQVIETGLLIRYELPWIGFSPDGIIINEIGEPKKILEIKSPKEGKHQTADDFLTTNSVKSLDANNNLKKRHAHYGQLQLGMLVLGVEETDYLVYSSIENNYLIVNVKYDATFISEMATTLCAVYFQELLPRFVRESEISHEYLKDLTVNNKYK